jgi:hypothetical protein
MSYSKLDTVAKTYKDLYAQRQPALEMFSLEASTAQHFEVNDKQFSDDVIRKAAKKL